MMTDTNLHLLQALATDVQKNAFCEEDTEVWLWEINYCKKFPGNL